MLENKTVIIGVSGGIASYKVCTLVSRLAQDGADVHVIMTENACRFVNPITFETLSGNRCLTDTFDRSNPSEVEHIALSGRADVFMIAPATANVIAKVANGLADDMLTTTFLACDAPKIVVPAMNTRMYENPVTRANLSKLEEFGVEVVKPASGHLACGDNGPGKMPEPEVLFSHIERKIAREKDMSGIRVLVSAGATREAIDPVRFITNHSSGKMGFALARECMLRGADVIIVKATAAVDPPPFCHVVDAVSAADMYREVTRRSLLADIILMAAAVSDFTPLTTYDEKVKKKDGMISIEFRHTMDILTRLGETKREGQYLCGFSMETENLISNSRSKLENKRADMIVANNLKVDGAGFETDTNVVTLITENGVEPLEKMTKAEVATTVINRIMAYRNAQAQTEDTNGI